MRNNNSRCVIKTENKYIYSSRSNHYTKYRLYFSHFENNGLQKKKIFKKRSV